MTDSTLLVKKEATQHEYRIWTFSNCFQQLSIQSNTPYLE